MGINDLFLIFIGKGLEGDGGESAEGVVSWPEQGESFRASYRASVSRALPVSQRLSGCSHRL